MKISTLLEILFILIIISFAASKPIDDGRAIKHSKTKVVAGKQQPTVIDANQPAIVSATPDKPTDEDDDDDDDDFGLGGDDDDDDDDSDDDDDEEADSDEDDDDDDDFGLGGDDDDDDDDDEEEEGQKDPATEDNDVDSDDFALLGDDLFDGIFDDSDTTTKKKATTTTTTIAPIVHIPVKQKVPVKSTLVNPSKPNRVIIKKPTQWQKVPITDVKKPVTEPLKLQHTTALLSLAQSQTQTPTPIPTQAPIVLTETIIKPVDGLKLENSVTQPQPQTDTIYLLKPQNEPQSNKIVIVEVPSSDSVKDQPNLSNQPVQISDDDDDENDDGMIIISSSDNNPLNEIDDLTDEKVEQPTESIPEADIIPTDKLHDSIVADPNQQIQVQQSTTIIPVKKPVKDEDDGLFGIVSSFIGDDDEDSKEDSTGSESVEEEDESGEPKPVDDDDDDDETDEEEDDDEDDDDTDDKKKQEKPSENSVINKDEKLPIESSNGSSVSVTGQKNKKKKKNILDFGDIGESLGFSRIFRANEERHL